MYWKANKMIMYKIIDENGRFSSKLAVLTWHDLHFHDFLVLVLKQSIVEYNFFIYFYIANSLFALKYIFFI